MGITAWGERPAETIAACASVSSRLATRVSAAPPPSGAEPWRSTSSVGVPASVTASRAAGRYFGAVNRTLAPLSRSNAAICGPLYAVSRGTATQPSCSTPR